MTWILIFLTSLVIGAVSTLLIKKIATSAGIIDVPGDERKIHSKPIALLGGVGLFIALIFIVVGYYIVAPDTAPALTDTHIALKQIIGILIGAFFLALGGLLDDKFTLKPYQQICWPLLAIASIIISGSGIYQITNPFGGVITLTPIISAALTTIWLLGVIYTTKLLDGVDGLVSGITVIGASIVAILSLFFFVNIPTALLATMIAGVFAGFLIFNFHPAKIFLGEAGSTLAGFLLGVLAIISGAKVATTILILGVPLFDMAWVITRRIFIEKKSMFSADRKHLHFRLLDLGLSQRTVVMIMYLFSAAFGIIALFLQSSGKLYALITLFILLIIAAIFLTKHHR